MDADHAAEAESRSRRIPELRERLKKAGRDPKSAPVSIFFAPPKKEALNALAAAGVERAIFGAAVGRTRGRAAAARRLRGAAMRG